MHQAISPLAILCLCVSELLSGSSALGDVVIVKSGRKYSGKVTERDDSYVVHQAGGKRISLPKSIVAKYIKSEAAQQRYDKALRRRSRQRLPRAEVVRVRRPVRAERIAREARDPGLPASLAGVSRGSPATRIARRVVPQK